VGNDLETVGVKHLALRVPSVREARATLEQTGAVVTDTARGRTGIDYFFVRDPDGIWVEIVQDDRAII
jgi:catechol 2,3-dioxygenase-like lactoylglutathione lyase family enzyme